MYMTRGFQAHAATQKDAIMNVVFPLDTLQVGDAVGLGAEARRVQEQLEERIKVGMALASEARAERERKGIAPPKVAFLEWTEPTYVGGHWTPELIEMAGGYARAYSVTPD